MKKRATILGVLLVLITGSFWWGSRYPALDEKAAMAGDLLGDVAGKFGFDIGAKLFPISHLLAVTPVEGTFLSEGKKCDRRA